MKKVAFEGARFVVPENPMRIAVSNIDVQQNARLDELHKIDEKHDRQFTWALVWAVITATWLLILTAIEALKGIRG